jgi:hypothetical protein
MQLVNKAASGDPKAIPVLLNETRFHETEAAAGLPSFTMAQEDDLVMANIVRRIREATPASLQLSTPEVHPRHRKVIHPSRRPTSRRVNRDPFPRRIRCHLASGFHEFHRALVL